MRRHYLWLANNPFCCFHTLCMTPNSSVACYSAYSKRYLLWTAFFLGDRILHWFLRPRSSLWNWPQSSWASVQKLFWWRHWHQSHPPPRPPSGWHQITSLRLYPNKTNAFFLSSFFSKEDINKAGLLVIDLLYLHKQNSYMYFLRENLHWKLAPKWLHGASLFSNKTYNLSKKDGPQSWDLNSIP